MFGKNKTLQFKRDDSIKKEDYFSKELKSKMTKTEIENKKCEYKFDKNTSIIPKRKDRLICIIFSEDKGASFIIRKINNKTNYFRFKQGMYIIDNEGIHITKNGTRLCFYLEGVSTPIKTSNIEKYTTTIEYVDLYGNLGKSTIQKIKGLKFDSKILDTFCDERFAQNFTKTSIDHFQLMILIFSIITLVVSVVACCLIYFYRYIPPVVSTVTGTG